MRSRSKNMPITVYHAITGRPMSEGQTIIMGGDNVNGVCERVRCFEQIERGEHVSGAIAELIRADMDRWKKVARREQALERVRRAEFPQYPSRMACLYASRTKGSDYVGEVLYGVGARRVRGGAADGKRARVHGEPMPTVSTAVATRRRTTSWRAGTGAWRGRNGRCLRRLSTARLSLVRLWKAISRVNWIEPRFLSFGTRGAVLLVCCGIAF